MKTTQKLIIIPIIAVQLLICIPGLLRADESEPSPTQGAEKPVLPPVETQAPSGILLNFKNAPLSDVLNYLSEAAGFVVVQETPVSGTINVVSLKPVNADEAVDLLNAVLVEKGFIAIRSGRILKIVSRKSAVVKDIPVRSGSDPAEIPRKDEMITQVIPVHHTDATKLIDNIKPFVSEDTNLSANQGSNAIVITDTQTNIRRIVQIIQALDTSISDIGEVRVFHLHNADAMEMATIINDLYSQAGNNNRNNGNQGGQGEGNFFRFFGGGGGQGFFPGGGGGRRNNNNGNGSTPLQSKVNAVGDPRTNSILITATHESMDQIAEMVTRLDSNPERKQRVFVYPLQYADANNVAAILRGIFSGQGGVSSTAVQAQEAAGNRLNQRSVNGAANRNASFGGGNQNNLNRN